MNDNLLEFINTKNIITYLAIINKYYVIYFDKHSLMLCEKNLDNAVIFQYNNSLSNNYLVNVIEKLAKLLKDKKYDEAYTFFKSL